MKVIDAHTGLEVHVGDRIPLPDPRFFSTPESSRRRMGAGLDDYYYDVLSIRPGIWSASMDTVTVYNGRARRETVPLAVRWTHPRYLLQHIAFVPS